ncbi:Zn-binding dehydrogenase [Rhodococcus wratislaviensis]|uniref:Zn-binding dehydrogenase n=1 Tax=Rhodococcus wratislaviensis TaxID=44752 RepID=A0AB38FIN1_RHOWR|nr:Zn-binding dehydrogenase [Rhodococcus wratislaviensis]
MGGVGTHIVQLARLVGAVPVIAFDINPAVRERALELGADYAFDSRDENLKEKVAEATDGRMLDVAFDATGLKVTFEQALDCLTVGGRLVAVGLSTVDVVANTSYHCRFMRIGEAAAT